MIPRRLPPFAFPSASDARPSPDAPTVNNTIPNHALAQTVPTQAQPFPQADTASGSAAASARKRRLPLPPVPRAIRPRINASPLQAALAIPRSPAPLQRQAQIIQAMTIALGHFGMEWNTLDEQHQQALVAAATHLPPAPHPPGVTETGLRQQQLSIQTAQTMAWLASQRQLLPQVIEPAWLSAAVPAVHYGGMTIEGPHLDRAEQRYFYLEQQCGHACAQHAVNAMVGGPLVSLAQFAQWEAHAQAQQGALPTPEAEIAAAMWAQGVHPETVNGALQALGIPTHAYVHRPVPDAQGSLVLDPAQAHFLDCLQTDRLLLQVDRYEDNRASSHYVAFRRDAGQWVLLDSWHDAPQYGVAPSDYLLQDETIQHFRAIWPQQALRGRGMAVAGGNGMPLPQGALVGTWHAVMPAPPLPDIAASAAAAGSHERTGSFQGEGNGAARVEAPPRQPAGALSKGQRKFLAGLAPYAAGEDLKKCQSESGLVSFCNCLSAAGGLKAQGQVMYDKLPQKLKEAVNEAIEARKRALVEKAMFTETVADKFLAGLVPYAAGEDLTKCQSESGLASFHKYLSSAGGLQAQGLAVYNKLPQELKAEVDEAIEARKRALVKKLSGNWK